MIPEWSERGYWTSGLDPLGLQAFPIELYQKLIPGLTNITVRPRYYSFYTWLCWVNAQRDDLRISDPTEWRRFIRRSEVIMTLSSLHAGLDNGYGMPGVEWAREFSLDDDVVDIRQAADPEYYEDEKTRYIKALQGVFGQAYKPVLQNALGALTQADEHEVPIPSVGIGDDLAHAFQANVGKTAETFLDCVGTGRVSRNEMKIIGQSFHPLSILPDSDEWRLLTDILLSGAGGNDSDASSRMLSMQFFLKVANQVDTFPSAWDFRWTAYSGYTPNGEVFDCPQELSSQVARWQAYQASDLLQLAIGSMFQLCVDRIPNEGAEEKAHIMQICQDMEKSIAPGTAKITWAQFRDNLKPAANASSLAIPFSEASLAAEVHSSTGTNKKLDSFSGAIAGIRLVAILEKRLREESWPAKTVFQELTSNRRSLKDVVGLLEMYCDRPVFEVLYALIREFVIKGHLTEAYRKLIGQNRFTFYFQIENGRLIQPAPEIVLNFTTPRLNTTLNFLWDLQLVGKEGITAHGKSFLEQAV
jgi:hypothetical protein